MAAAAWDALALDGELEAIFHARLDRVLAPSKFTQRLQPELLALLRSALLYLSSTSMNAASPGLALLGLRRCVRSSAEHGGGTALPPHGTASLPRTPSASRMLVYAAVAVVLPWAWVRLSQLLTSRAANSPSVGRQLRTMRRLEGLAALASLIVTLRFLQRSGVGVAPTVPMLLAGLRLMPTLQAAARPPAFDFMEQQLIWRCVADVMLAGRRLWHAGPASTPATLVGNAGAGPASVTTAAHRHLARLGRHLRLLPPAAADHEGPPAAAEDLNSEACVFCGAASAHTARELACGHRGCYYCVTTARMASAWARCPVHNCGARLAEQT